MIMKLHVDAHIHEGGEDKFMTSYNFCGSWVDLLAACETIIRRVMQDHDDLMPLLGLKLIEGHFGLNEEDEDGEQEADADED